MEGGWLIVVLAVIVSNSGPTVLRSHRQEHTQHGLATFAVEEPDDSAMADWSTMAPAPTGPQPVRP
jgi:hypothetical protein